MKVNLNRLKENLSRVGEIGRKEGQGITRLAFSEEFYEASSILSDLMRDAGLDVKKDGIGNVFGIKKGKDNSLPCIMIGSHLDTVRNGGLFDGTLGVISALECVYMMKENKIETRHPIEIVAFNAEEGNEVGGTFGSRVMMGIQDPYEKGLKEKLSKYGISESNLINSIRNTDMIKAFLEMHIEQGGDLDSKGIPIGVVEGIAGITRYKISAHGEANHAGTTPMTLRRDALIAASKLIIEIDRVAKAMGNPFVATIGTLDIYPGAVNVIPGLVQFVLELRDLQEDRVKIAVEKIKKVTNNIREAKFEFELLINKTPVTTDNDIMHIIEKCCQQQKIEYQIMASGAGHDAKEIARLIPTGMIFVPSKGGKSHCSEEFTEYDDIEKGIKVLFDTILAIDSI